MAAGLFPDARLEVPVVVYLHQGNKLAGVWLYNVPAHGHSWGCLQGEGEGLAITGVSQIPLDLTGQGCGDKVGAVTVSCPLCLSCLFSKSVT